MEAQSPLAVNNIDVTDAAKILGCSYPHLINLIHKGKLQAIKVGKSWLVDAADVQRAKAAKLVTPRPRKNKKSELSFSYTKSSSIESLGQDEIEIRIKLPKSKYQLISLALESKEKKNLKQHIESVVDQLHEKIQKHIEGVDF